MGVFSILFDLALVTCSFVSDLLNKPATCIHVQISTLTEAPSSSCYNRCDNNNNTNLCYIQHERYFMSESRVLLLAPSALTEQCKQEST